MSVRDVIEQNADRYVGWLVEACSMQSLAEHPEADGAHLVRDGRAQLVATGRPLCRTANA